MAAGDLITRDGQYEFSNLLFNNGDWLQVESIEGLFDLPPTKSSGDSEMVNEHGERLGRDLLQSKEIIMVIGVSANTDGDLYLRKRAVSQAFQPRSDLLPLVYQMAGTGKLYIPVRPRRLNGFQLNYSVAMTRISRAAALLKAPDPRILSFNESTQPIQIASGATSAQADITMGGNFRDGAWPILEIAGPATNPRITNNVSGRTIRIDNVIEAGQTLIVDVKARTVTKGGIDAFSSVRNDNQWWTLLPGTQTISWTRADSPANTATLTVRWRNSYAA